MKALEALKTRKSVRKYTEETVKKEDLMEILECGALAPTGYNKQPFKFVVIDDVTLRDAMLEKHPYSKGTSAHYLIAVLAEMTDSVTPLEDACAATENMLIAATALGYGTCWLQVYDCEWAKELEEMLNVPQGYQMINLFTLGCFEDNGKRAPKKPLEELIHFNQF